MLISNSYKIYCFFFFVQKPRLFQFINNKDVQIIGTINIYIYKLTKNCMSKPTIYAIREKEHYT